VTRWCSWCQPLQWLAGAHSLMDWLLTDRHQPLSRHALFTSEILSHDIQQIQLSHTNHQLTGSGIFYLASITVYSDTHLSHSTSHERLPSIFIVYGQQQSTDVMRSEFRCIQEMVKYIPVCMQFGLLSSFNALILLLAWQEGHPACKKPDPINPGKVLF